MPSIVPGFEYDIFISYRHKDNKGEHWVTEFVNTLKTELESTFKEDISIYFDENPHDGLLETHDVDDSLRAKLKCLIFIPIISQTYCDTKSFAWNHEFLAFKKLANEDQFGLKVKLTNGNVSSRILPVRIHDLDSADKAILEDQLGPLRSIDFIFKSPGVNRPLRALEDHPNDNLNKSFYRDQINKVANTAKEIIQGMRTPVVREATKLSSKVPVVLKGGRNKMAVLATLVLVICSLAFFFGPSLFSQWAQKESIGKSIAVLAFDDLSPNHDQEYIGDGIAEELIYTLSKVPDLKVAGRHSAFTFKDKNVDLKQIAIDLGVSTVLTGSVRKSESKIRVFVQLINAVDGFQIWSEQYDKDLNDILTVQQDIALSVISSLQLSKKADLFSPQGKIISPEAYEIYLRGRQKLALRGANLIEARSLFEESIKLDSTFSPAYSGLGRVLTLLPYNSFSITSNEAIIEGKKVVRKALELDSTNAEAYAVRAGLAGFYEWDWNAAKEAITKAYSMSPQNAEIVNFLGDYYRQVRHPRKLEIEKLAVVLDPLRALNYSDVGLCYALDGDYKNAVIQFRKSFEMNPIAYDGSIRSLVKAYLKIGEVDEAKKIIQRVKSLNEDGTKDMLLSELNFTVSAMTGQKEVTKADLAELETLVKSGKYSPFFIAELFKLSGHDDKAIEMLELAYQQRNFSFLVSSLDLFYPNPTFENFFKKKELAELLRIRKENESN